ncbi:type II toxin-antitoxin system HicA family toxin [Candidatus Gottesmanbacteria bacterium]|nr:type II toxin-antitoxin system HicA family toxin [Candidatus Gottesmanbacteria bacterium]
MPKLPQVKPRDVEKILVKRGFAGRPGKGGHVVFGHPDGRRTVVPGHNRPVRTGTLRAILRQAEISVEEFVELL